MLAAALPFCSHALAQNVPAPSVDSQAVRDVAYLTSFAVHGRGYYHGGHDSAARFIAARFKALGLEGLGDGYMQAFPMRVNEFPGSAMLVADGRPLLLGVDWLPSDWSGSGTLRDVRATYVGTGLFIPERDVNEWGGRDVKGRIVVIEDTVPKKWTADTSVDREYLSIFTRMMVAKELGAVGVVILKNGLEPGKAGEAFELPVAEVKRSAWPVGAERASMAVESRVIKVEARNVAALLRGTGTTDSTIILCAHYDHLGGIGDSVYFPGANDNASGTAMLLNLAAYFKEHPLRLSIAFVAFSGEEAGLIGSQYFAEHPLVDLKKARFLLNLDMTASGAEGVMAVGGEEFVPEFEAFRAVAESLGVTNVRKRPNAQNSDHYPIIGKGVRGFYIYPFTGQQPYHNIKDLPATLEWNVWARMRSIAIGLLSRL